MHPFGVPGELTANKDSSLLYVSERGRHRIVTLEIDDEGNLENHQVFVELKDGGSAECLLFDARGQLYASVPGQGILIIDPEGETVSTLDLPSAAVSGMAFGGLEFDNLFICEGDGVYRVSVEVPGQRPFAGPRSV